MKNNKLTKYVAAGGGDTCQISNKRKRPEKKIVVIIVIKITMKSKWKSGIVIVVTIKNESKGFSDISVILMYLLFNIKGADTLLKCWYCCYQTCISLSDES